MIVLDASGAISGVLPSQATAKAKALLESDPAPRFIAPACFAWEMRNALLKAERRNRLTATQVDQAILTLDALVACAPWDEAPPTFVRLLAQARAEALSLFDAAYLDLARREGADLASRDSSLLDAARRRGVPVHDLR